MRIDRFIKPVAALLSCALLGFASCAREDDPALYIAAAADLKFALDDIIDRFREEHPRLRVRVTYGSSGHFFTQLSNRAPFDLYFSADFRYPQMLVERGLADEEALFHYAVGRIAVWALRDAPMDVDALGADALLHPEVRKVAIANPRHAPYGVAAEAALRSLGVYERIEDKLVLGENVAQAAQFIESGAASIGVIALSLAEAPAMRKKGVYWEIPLDRYPRMDQGGLVTPWARNPEAARAFRDYVLGEEGRGILEAYGFAMPEDGF